ncbi:hypothetical protein FHG87_022704 [Trinorchestia longiramus]|nr:hypothetical protein FHG87_022704 [Trinorchestia longiramus]
MCTWLKSEGKRGANEICSCLLEFLKTQNLSAIEHVKTFSDCCGDSNCLAHVILDEIGINNPVLNKTASRCHPSRIKWNFRDINMIFSAPKASVLVDTSVKAEAGFI